MSNSSVNTGFAKCFILFMAIVVLLQGCAYVGLGVYGVIMKKCSEETTNIMDQPIEFAIDLIYFANKDCPPSVTITHENISQTVVLDIDFDKSSIITDRMTIFLYVYIVVSALWVITSLLVIFNICGRLTNLVSMLCFWPWFLCVAAGSILDAVATGYHIHDILKTTSAEETFDYVGVRDASDVLTYIESFEMFFITPAVILTCLSSRVVLVWLLNIFGTAFCLSISRVVANSISSQEASKARSQEDTNFAGNSGQQRAQPVPAMTAQQHQPQFQQQMIQPAEVYPKQIQPKPLTIQVVPPPQIRKSQQPTPYFANEPQSPHYYPAAIYPSAPTPDANADIITTVEFNRQPSVARKNNTNTNDDNVTYRPVDSHPDRLNYPIQSTVVEERGAPSSEFSIISPLNNRYATTTDTHNSQPQRVSEELRGQLPWSYTNLTGGKPLVPRKPQVKAYPQIPAPDYTKYD